jgi:hypothetical protein
MPESTVLSRPDASVEALIAAGRRNRCACCGGPVVPIIDYSGPQDERQGYYRCTTCRLTCQMSESNGERQFTHQTRPRLDWDQADRRWAADLGFKRLGTSNVKRET